MLHALHPLSCKQAPKKARYIIHIHLPTPYFKKRLSTSGDGSVDFSNYGDTTALETSTTEGQKITGREVATTTVLEMAALLSLGVSSVSIDCFRLWRTPGEAIPLAPVELLVFPGSRDGGRPVDVWCWASLSE